MAVHLTNLDVLSRGELAAAAAQQVTREVIGNRNWRLAIGRVGKPENRRDGEDTEADTDEFKGEGNVES